MTIVTISIFIFYKNFLYNIWKYDQTFVGKLKSSMKKSFVSINS